MMYTVINMKKYYYAEKGFNHSADAAPTDLSADEIKAILRVAIKSNIRRMFKVRTDYDTVHRKRRL